MNDTISRQAALDATWFEPSYTDPLNVLTEVRDRLKVLPSAQPEITEDDVNEYCRKRCLIVVTSDFYKEMMKRWSQPERKKGRWIDIKCGTVSLWACSKCGEVYAENFHYCPNCGADMREGEKE